MKARPLVVVNAVGLTPRMLPMAPRIRELAESGWLCSLEEVLPAVTCTAQASMLTGKMPSKHGIVANGWLFRETQEVRFWQQSNRLLNAEPFYVTARRRAARREVPFSCAKLFWWFNQGAQVEYSVTPKPYYGANGDKRFGIASDPEPLARRLEKNLGPFPFSTFWGPMAGIDCTRWIARAAADVLQNERPQLTLVYLPHLDYNPQRFGPSGCQLEREVKQLDDAMEPLLSSAKERGARVWIVSEYGHCDVQRVIHPNRLLRKAGLLSVRKGPFGENVDLFASRAFAVCDHQICHIYVRDPESREAACVALNDPAIAHLVTGEDIAAMGLDHPRSGEIIALAHPDAWFAYPYWLDDYDAPDFARTVDIHRKIGFDPCEMFFDPTMSMPKVHAACRLMQKKLGFRTLFDVVSLDASIVKGSHGLKASDPQDRPLLIGGKPSPAPAANLSITDVRDQILAAMGLEEE